jgi:hypothetical protein
MKLLQIIVVTLPALLLVGWPHRAFASTPPEWEEPVPLGDELPAAWFPEMATDSTGRVLLTWMSPLNEKIDAVEISELGQSTWSTPSDIFVMDFGIASRPIIASDGKWAHVIFRYGSQGSPELLHYSRAPLSEDLLNAKSWSKPQQLVTDESYWSQLLVLPDGTLIVSFNQMTRVEINGRMERRPALYIRRSTDSGVSWSTPVRISSGIERVGRNALTATPDGQTLVAAWDLGYDRLTGTGDIYGMATAVSTDAGITWGHEQIFPEPVERSTVITNGALTMLVYRSTVVNQLYYRTSSDLGKTWSDELHVPKGIAAAYSGKHNFDKISLAMDGDGRVLVAWIGANVEAPKGLSVMVMTYADRTWTEPVAVASPDGYPEYPRLVVALGNQVHLAYFVRDDQFRLGHYTVWTAHGRSDALSSPPVAMEPALAAPNPTPIVPTPAVFPVYIPPTVPAPGPETTVLRTSPQQAVNQPIIAIVTVTVVGLPLLLLGLVAVVATARRTGNL